MREDWHFIVALRERNRQGEMCSSAALGGTVLAGSELQRPPLVVQNLTLVIFKMGNPVPDDKSLIKGAGCPMDSGLADCISKGYSQVFDSFRKCLTMTKAVSPQVNGALCARAKYTENKKIQLVQLV